MTDEQKAHRKESLYRVLELMLAEGETVMGSYGDGLTAAENIVRAEIARVEAS